MTRIVAFNGSPKGRKSRTQFLVDAFLEGARSAGAEAETVFLAERSIVPCDECMGCWVLNGSGECTQEDDVPALLEKAMEVDFVLLATPLLMDSMSGILKLFLERWLPLMHPRFRAEHGQGTLPARKGRVPDWIILSSCSFPEQFHFQPMSLMFRELSKSFNNRLAAEIYRGEADLFGRLGEMAHLDVLNPYMDLLRTAGHEVVRNGSLSQATAEALDRPLIPFDQYVEEGNAAWDRILEGTCRIDEHP
jgi:putative NADPH-quinone reductase